MENKINLSKFKKKVNQLVRFVEKSANEAPGVESKSRHYRDKYQAAAMDVLKRLIEPRLEMVADQFEDASIDVSIDAGYARLSFLHQKLPAVVYLLFCLRLDYSARMVRLYAESCLTPYSLDCEPSAAIVITLNSPDLGRAEAFIEEQIFKFLKGYLRTNPKNSITAK